MTRKPVALLLLLLLGGGSGKGIYDYLNRKDPIERTEEKNPNQEGDKIPAIREEKIKILELVNNDALPYSGFDAQGEKLVNKVKADAKKLKEIFKDNLDKAGLINGCKGQKEKEILVKSKDKNKDLIQTKEGCILTIREEIGDERALKAKSTDKSEDRESGKIKALILSKYGEEEASTDAALIEKIKKIKDPKLGNKLTDGCKDVYQLGYKTETAGLLKLANKFCTKPTNRDMIVGGGLSTTAENLDTEGTKKVEAAEKDDEVKKIVESEDKKTKLKDGCKEQFKQLVLEKIADDNTNANTLERIKKLCVLTNKEKLGEDQVTITDTTGNSDKTLGEGKMTKIEEKKVSHQDLKEISKKHKDKKGGEENNAGKELRAGCKSIQDKGYAGENDADFKLAKEICTNS